MSKVSKALADALDRGNPVVFFDIAIAGTPQGRISMELFKDQCPKTAENFRHLHLLTWEDVDSQLCTGEMRKNGQPVGYKGSKFHRIIKKFMVQGGDFINGDGTGKMSIYGAQFDDENLTLKHDVPGLLSMANSGPNTNACQFFLTCEAAEWLDEKHVVFGKILDDSESILVLRKLENVSVSTDGTHQPRLECTIAECGEL